METKTAKAIVLWRAGEVKKALSIFATFKVWFTKSERRTIQIAYESLKGHEAFYQQLGVDTDIEIQRATKLISEKYL